MSDENNSRNKDDRTRRLQLDGLWRQPDFLRLWIGQTISEFGSWLGALALFAILVLEATPAQMGLLETLKAIPALLLGLFAGVWIDRGRRRPILIGSDIGRSLLLGLVVLLAFAGLLQMTYLYIVAFLVGGLTVIFNLAYQAYIPSIVRRDELVEANSKMGATASIAEIASPGLGGLLVQVISAPLTLLLDSLSYLVSAIFVATIKTPEPVPAVAVKNQSVWQDAVTGLRLVISHPLLRATAAAAATRGFFGGFFAALYGLYVLREVGLGPATLGILIGSGGIGSFFGAIVTGRFTGRFGWGNSLILASLVSGLLALLIPLAAGPKPLAFAILFIGQIVGDLFMTIYLISELSLRQTITPDRLLGRVNASYGFFVGGVSTLGIFVGGLLGQTIGLRPATAVAAVGISMAFLWLLFSPVRGLEDLSSWRLADGE